MKIFLLILLLSHQVSLPESKKYCISMYPPRDTLHVYKKIYIVLTSYMNYSIFLYHFVLFFFPLNKTSGDHSLTLDFLIFIWKCSILLYKYTIIFLTNRYWWTLRLFLFKRSFKARCCHSHPDKYWKHLYWIQ